MAENEIEPTLETDEWQGIELSNILEELQDQPFTIEVGKVQEESFCCTLELLLSDEGGKNIRHRLRRSPWV